MTKERRLCKWPAPIDTRSVHGRRDAAEGARRCVVRSAALVRIASSVFATDLWLPLLCRMENSSVHPAQPLNDALVKERALFEHREVPASVEHVRRHVPCRLSGAVPLPVRNVVVV